MVLVLATAVAATAKALGQMSFLSNANNQVPPAAQAKLQQYNGLGDCGAGGMSEIDVAGEWQN